MQVMPDPRTNVARIIGEVASLLKASFRSTPAIFGALGNDDSERNYFQPITTKEPENTWFRLVAEQLSPSWSMSQDAVNTYAYGSYFEVKEGNITFLSLATVMYSARHTPFVSEEDPFGQFAWLRQKLSQAARERRRVWILGHIPPGIETFSYTELWHSQYVASYLRIVQDKLLGSVIAAQLFGHVHKDEFRILPDPPEGAGPIILSASLSPVYYNNPAFKKVKYCKKSGKLQDVETFFSRMSSTLDWRFGYRFCAAFPETEGFLMKDFVALARRLLDGQEEFKQYAKWYAAEFPSDLQKWASAPGDRPQVAEQKLQRRHQYVCAVTVQNQFDYQNCLNSARAAVARPGHFGQPVYDVGRMIRMIPTDFDDWQCMLLGKLLRWAELSQMQSATEVLRLAQHEMWKTLLSEFGPRVERALESGNDLDMELNAP